MTLGIELYKLLKDFPKYEQYALCDQMRRCLISIPSNIAEGHARSSQKEFLNFLSISRGSLAELQTQIQFAIELEYIDRQFGENIKCQLSGVDIMIVKLMENLKKNSGFLNSMKSLLLSLLP